MKNVNRDSESLLVSGIIVILVVVDVHNNVGMARIEVNSKLLSQMVTFPRVQEWSDEIKCRSWQIFKPQEIGWYVNNHLDGMVFLIGLEDLFSDFIDLVHTGRYESICARIEHCLY